MTTVFLGTFIIPLFIVGAIFLALGLSKKDRLLRILGDLFMAAGLALILVFTHALDELEMNGMSDYAVFVGLAVPAGLLAGDALAQAILKKSSSS